MPPKITLRPEGFAAFASVQGGPPNRGIKQIANGQWFGWQLTPKYNTALYDTRDKAKEALLRHAPKERQ